MEENGKRNSRKERKPAGRMEENGKRNLRKERKPAGREEMPGNKGMEQYLPYKRLTNQTH